MLHGNGKHSTAQCHTLINNPDLKARLQATARRDPPPAQQVHTTTTDNGYGFVFTMHAKDLSADNRPWDSFDECKTDDNQGLPSKACMPQYMLSTQTTAAKINRWCVDGASTIMATWDRCRCFNIRSCRVQIDGSNAASDAGTMICTEVGDTEITVYDKDTGRSSKHKITNVLINEAFPFHIFSEIVAGERGAKCIKQHGSWSFFNDTGFILHASQQMNLPAAGDQANKLYWIDEHKATVDEQEHTAVVNVSRSQDMWEHVDVFEEFDHHCQVCGFPEQAHHRACTICCAIQPVRSMADAYYSSPMPIVSYAAPRLFGRRLCAAGR